MSEEVKHWRDLIKVYKRRLRLLERRAAEYGGDCPPHIQTDIEDTEEQVSILEEKIAAASDSLRQTLVSHEQTFDSIGDNESAQTSQKPPYIDCPYPGMVPFRTEDARFFYGRETEIQSMLQHLRYHRYLFVVGPSGSGKSSLIFAGLLPRLRKSSYFPQDFWLIRSMRPGDQPLQTLADVIEGNPKRPTQSVIDVLVANQPTQKLLLIIDQFEELFTQSERAEQNRFIAMLKALQEIRECTLVVAMRADFYPELMTSDLWPIPLRKRFEIAPLRGNTLRQAIQQPAVDVGVRLETALLERLLADAANEPGVLPLVQETMVVLWEHMIDGVLSARAYERLGGEGRSGLAVALALKADAAIEELTPDQQVIAQRVFLRLVQFGEGRSDTRRQQPFVALQSFDDDSILFEQTVRHLTNNRLLTLSGEEGSPDSRVDIAHEALISSWPMLQEWVAKSVCKYSDDFSSCYLSRLIEFIIKERP